MKHRQKICLRVVVCIWSRLQTSYAQLEIPGDPWIFNESQAQYLQANDLNNPLRDGAYAAIKNPDGEWVSEEQNSIIWVQWAKDEITSHTAAKAQTLKIINKAINYALGMLSLIALIYLMYHGFIILTAAGDDSKYKQWMKGIKYAAIAIAGIGLSWIFISTIFWAVNAILKGDIWGETVFQKEVQIEKIA